MSPRTIRRLVLAVFVGGIVGMIVGSILDNNGVAITFGLVTATAAVGLILVTAVAPSEALRHPGDDTTGEAVEEQVELLLSRGADEVELRELVRRSIAFGRRSGRG